jgi:co-chaperonin GroES (HSP10)
MQTLREKHVTINIKNIENIVPQNDYVLCKRLHNNITDLTLGGIQRTTESWNRDQFLTENSERIFEIISLPDKLKGCKGKWKTQIDLQVGDKVVVQYYGSLNSKVIKTQDCEYRFILYYDIITKVYPDKLIPINGYILFTTLKLAFNTNLVIPEYARKTDPRYGIIEHISPPNEYYIREKNYNYDKGIDIKVRDKVIFIMPIDRFAPILEDKKYRTLDKEYYYCQRHRIGAKIE